MLWVQSNKLVPIIINMMISVMDGDIDGYTKHS